MLSRRLVLCGGAAVALTGCESPSPTLYTLAPVPGPVRSGAPPLVELRVVSLARYLDRPQIVRSSEGFRLDILSNDWWGEPPATMLGRIMLQNLTQRLPGTTLFAENGAVSSLPDAILGIAIQRMDLDQAGALRLLAQISVARRQPIARNVSLSETPSGAGTLALVAAMSAAIGGLSDQAATMLTA